MLKVVPNPQITSRGGANDAQPAGDLYPRIHSIADLPPVKRIFSARGEKFELSESVRVHLVAIGSTDDRATIVVDLDRLKADPRLDNHLASLRSRLRASHIRCDVTFGASADLIAAIYGNNQATLAAGMTDIVTNGGMLFEEVITYGYKIGASDVHWIVKGAVGQVRFRVHGDMEDMRNDAKGRYTAEQIKSALGYAYNKLVAQDTNSESAFSTEKSVSGMVPYTVNGKEFNLRWESARGFASSLSSGGGFTAFLRYIPVDDSLREESYASLGYAPDHADMFAAVGKTRKGVILIIGETNSGKSTLARHYLENLEDVDLLNIITVEDPAEREIRVASLQRSLQRSFADNASQDSYRDVKPQIMRSDPNIIFQGEIRDPDSGDAAKTFRETGHQVIATAHADSIMGVFPRLASSDIGFSMHTLTTMNFWALLVAQQLVATLCSGDDGCADYADETVPHLTEFIRTRFGIKTDKMRTKHIGGCRLCDGRGTTGVTVVAEAYQPTRPFLKALRNGDEYAAERIWRSESDGRFDTPYMTGKTLFEHALYKAYLGQIDVTQLNRIELIDRYEILNAKEGLS